MPEKNLRAHPDRLAALSMGLAREAQLWANGGDFLLTKERNAYLDGLHAARSGLEAARVALAVACARLGGR